MIPVRNIQVQNIRLIGIVLQGFAIGGLLLGVDLLLRLFVIVFFLVVELAAADCMLGWRVGARAILLIVCAAQRQSLFSVDKCAHMGSGAGTGKGII